MKTITLLILTFLAICACKVSTPQPYKKKTKHQFIGKIIEVKLFPCEMDGSKISSENAVWENGYGSFKCTDSLPAIGLSEAKVAVSRWIRGKLKLDTVVVESFSEQLTVYLKKVDRQIITQYFYAPPTHGGDAIILPKNSIGKERTFYCNPPFSNLEGHVTLIASVLRKNP